MRVKLQRLNYNASKAVTEPVFQIIEERIGKPSLEKLFNNYVVGQAVSLEPDGFPVQWFDMMTSESMEEYLAIDGLEFRFEYEHILYDAIIRLRLATVAHFD